MKPQTQEVIEARERIQHEPQVSLTLAAGYFWLGEAYRIKGNQPLGEKDSQKPFETYQNSIRAYNQALEIDPKEPIFYIGRGKAYFQLANSFFSENSSEAQEYFAKARDDFRNVTESNVKDANAHYWLSRVLEKQKDIRSSCRELNKAYDVFYEEKQYDLQKKVQEDLGRLDCKSIEYR